MSIIIRHLSLLLTLCVAVGAGPLKAQMKKAGPELVPTEQTAKNKTEAELQSESDSLSWIVSQLEEALSSERHISDSLMMELDDLRFQVIAGDSLRLAAMTRVIDSLRPLRQGVPLVVHEDTLFYIYANRGARDPDLRVQLTGECARRARTPPTP